MCCKVVFCSKLISAFCSSEVILFLSAQNSSHCLAKVQSSSPKCGHHTAMVKLTCCHRITFFSFMKRHHIFFYPKSVQVLFNSFLSNVHDLQLIQIIFSFCVSKIFYQGWEFIKEKKKVRKQENTHTSTQKRTHSRKHALIQESVHAKKNSRKKTCTKTHTCTRKRP